MALPVLHYVQGAAVSLLTDIWQTVEISLNISWRSEGAKDTLLFRR